MKNIGIIKEDLNFLEAVEEFEKGHIIRSYITEYAYYKDRKTNDIYRMKVVSYEESTKEFKLIKLDENMWSSGEVQGKWNVLFYQEDIPFSYQEIEMIDKALKREYEHHDNWIGFSVEDKIIFESLKMKIQYRILG